MLRSDRFDEVNNRLTSSCIELGIAVVTDDDIVAGVSRNELTGIQCVIDSVTAATGDDDVVALANDDFIDATDVGIC